MFKLISVNLRSRTALAVAPRHFCTRKQILDEARERKERDIKRLQWQPTDEERGEWYSKFKLFANEKEDMNLLTILAQPRDVSIKGIKGWIGDRKEQIERAMQSYIPERHEMLGKDLAAAHFVVHRGGKIRFVGQKEWVQRDENEEYDLPKFFDRNYKVEAVDFEGMDLFYEGLQNLIRLEYLKFLSFKGVKRFDDWCMDRVSGSEFKALEILNLSNTKITYRGLGALYRIPSLRTLILDDPKDSKKMELTIFMLQDIIPQLEVKFVN